MNDTHYAVLRVLAGSEAALTVREISDLLPGLGKGGANLAPSTTKEYLKGLKWNNGRWHEPLARPVGVGPRNATTWAITEHGRGALAAEDARLARES